ncbi:hypothetical protein D3C79_734670 [compost metagenome]
MLESSIWSAARMFTAKCDACSNTSWLVERLSMLHKINAGSSDTELKLLAVTPTVRPSGAAAVTTVTPVAKLPSARRKARLSKPAAVAVSLDMQDSRADQEPALFVVVFVRGIGQPAAQTIAGSGSRPISSRPRICAHTS